MVEIKRILNLAEPIGPIQLSNAHGSVGRIIRPRKVRRWSHAKICRSADEKSTTD